ETDSITNKITGVSEANAGADGSFENLTYSGKVVSNIINDDSDSVKVRLSTSGATSEDGGSITYTATINHAAKNDVTVTTEQGDIVILAKGTLLDGGGVADGLSGTLTIDVNRDDVYNETDSITNKITGVSEANAGADGSFENLTYSGKVVSNIINDDSDITTATITVNITNSESAVITVQMSNVPDPTTYDPDNKPVVYVKLDGSDSLIGIEINDSGYGTKTINDISPYINTTDNLLTVSYNSIVGGNYELVEGNVITDNIPIIVTPQIGEDAAVTGDIQIGTEVTGSLNFTFGSDGASTTNPVTISYNGALGAATTTSTSGITTIAANDGTWTLVINETTGAYTFTQNSAYTHPDGVDSVSGLVTVTITDADGDSTSTQLELKITDDIPSVTVDDLYVNRSIGLTTDGVITFDSGADSVDLVHFINNGDSKLTWVGMDDAKFDFTETSSTDTSKTFSATYLDANNVEQTYFSVTVNNDGTYDFNLLQPAPTIVTPSGELFGGLELNSAGTEAYISSDNFGGAFDVLITGYRNGTQTYLIQNDAIGVAGNTINKNGDTMKFDIRQQSGYSNSTLSSFTIIADAKEAGIKTTSDVALTLYYTDGSSSSVYGDITSNIVDGKAVSYNIDFDINTSKVLDYVILDPVDCGLKVTGISMDYTTTIDPSDIPLQFNLEGEDSDGDAATANFNVILMSGTEGNDTITTGSDDSSISGGAGDDYLDGGAGKDALYGGAGDDTLVFDKNDTIIDGGTGNDTLVLGSNDNIDFSALDNPIIKNIESIDLTAGNHSLTKLTLQDVIDMTDGTDKTLTITGNVGDTVELTGGWTQAAPTTIGAVNYDTFTQDSGTDTYRVLVHPDIDTTN
ncbi:MAG: hypothetical protein PHG81_07860, partial [Aliarcobacter sp.]|nr:hypothetical protein [Aliarcobacter sp.]